LNRPNIRFSSPVGEISTDPTQSRAPGT
jgi:hypothetical protein